MSKLLNSAICSRLNSRFAAFLECANDALDALKIPFQLRKVCRMESALRYLANGIDFQRFPNLIQVDDVLPAEIDDDRAAVGSLLEQAVGDETPDCLAHWRAAGSEDARQLQLGDDLPSRQGSGAYLFEDVVVDPMSGRSRRCGCSTGRNNLLFLRSLHHNILLRRHDFVPIFLL